ncbi:DNA-binding protein HU 2 [Nitrospina gracilis 3/211]|uniref:DNA-binding protein HU 2 n=1 Tax=Nitrospina gracilis (strain 3/211) TaxID=1266370 RepID=M1YVU2_NITG3|nr:MULTISPECIES: HU family DNA-binding protein [Nitrospina]MCF8719957.1 DNA-binding protein HU-beta [Nitrospina gracilis Nb-211]CCQ89430.1 DNA-binding protein HU 2 [Nitrospina gracilis 3/211]
MTKDELIASVTKNVKDSNLSKRLAGDVVDATFDVIAKAIKKDKRFAYPGFGTFTVRTRKARKGRNPQTGEEIKIKASKTVGFKPAPNMKNSL